MRRRLAIASGALVVLLVVAELAAVPLTTRLLVGILERCGFGFETFAVTAVDRPVVPRLLVGRARDVELTATGLTIGDLRVEAARLRLPEAALPWAPGAPEPAEVDAVGDAEVDAVGDAGAAADEAADVADAVLAVTIIEADLQRAVRARVPLGLPVTVDLAPGIARLGAAGLPVTLDLAVELQPDGAVRLTPVAGDTALFDRLGLAARIDPGETARLTRLRLGDGEVSGTVAIPVVPGVGDGDACDEPIAMIRSFDVGRLLVSSPFGG